MKGKSQTETNVFPLPDDWLNLSQTSGLFHLVAARTSPRGHDEKKMSHVTVHQARIFGHIFSHPDVDVRIKRLAHDLDVTPAAASQAVDRLVSDGLLDRRPDPKDRRAVVITISDKGRQLLDEIKTESHSLLADIYREIGITAEEAATFSKVLAAIHAALLARWRRYISGSADGPSAYPKAVDETTSITSGSADGSSAHPEAEDDAVGTTSGSADGPSAYPKAEDEGLASSTQHASSTDNTRRTSRPCSGIFIVNEQHEADEPSALRQLVDEGLASSPRIVNGQHEADGPSAPRHP